MEISSTSFIERIGRVIAGHALSSNADGAEDQAAINVDIAWKDHRDTAIAILKALREPDEETARAGDADVWRRMIETAILQI